MLPELGRGVWVSVQIAFLGILLGFAVGVGAALIRSSPNRAIALMGTIYIEMMRNSPSLVKMYFIYFGLPSLGFYPSAFVSGVAALALHNGAHMAEIFRGGLLAVPSSQLDAARSLGMGPWQCFRIVLFPQAFRNALPAFSNNWVEIIKDTSLTSALSVRELFYVVSKSISETLRSFEFLAVAALIYLALTSTLSGILRYFETRIKFRPDGR
ncbi:hypothetical protein AB833_02135 [Chromatiales bacterium (ex Bugula neritina AB1)]|nr:hypothetical protein AB833_02135 [Chromatiales bacterium (ex Bugula neritina AB1)]